MVLLGIFLVGFFIKRFVSMASGTEFAVPLGSSLDVAGVGMSESSGFTTGSEDCRVGK